MTTRKSLQLRGLYPAPSLPFDADYKIAEREFVRHVAPMGRIPGIGGVAVNGHQGEIAALSTRERQRVVELARENLPKSRTVIAGVLGLSIEDTARGMQEAKEAGADAALVLPPFDYIGWRVLAKSWEACYAFFAGLADRVDLPMIIFQYPFASGISYATDTLLRLAEIDNVVGVKNHVQHLELYIEQWEALRGKLAMLAARDAPGLLTKMQAGADGALIGISGIAPELWAQFVSDCLEGRMQQATELFMARLVPIMTHVWNESLPRRVTNRATTKEALRQLGVFSSSRVRPPELDVNEHEAAMIRAGLEKAGLLASEAGKRRSA